MSTAIVVPALTCLLPVLGLLVALVVFDSYKLVRLGTVVGLTLAGGAIAMGCYFVNGWLIARLGIGLQAYARYVSPFVEEAGKGLLIVWLIRRHRIGFLIDAAIVGFALGCGFAVAENLYTLWRLPSDDLSLWIIRGFGTAIMHGGATALFALISVAILELGERHGPRALLPGFAIAVALHSGFNHMSREAALSVPIVLIVVASLLLVAYHRGERSLERWLGHGIDTDAELMALIREGRLNESATGRYVITLRERFGERVVADLLRYLHLFTELSLSARGVVLMRDSGLDTEVDPEVLQQMMELRHLERRLGKTGLLALHPLLPMRRRDLRRMLDPGGGALRRLRRRLLPRVRTS